MAFHLFVNVFILDALRYREFFLYPLSRVVCKPSFEFLGFVFTLVALFMGLKVKASPQTGGWFTDIPEWLYAFYPLSTLGVVRVHPIFMGVCLLSVHIVDKFRFYSCTAIN